ncbi:acyl-CoA dehydrogenase NM domain-like protein [Conidiobolus coronatus NRRL 28638]|uniref:Acyl-CoA dehydrogenase NM domain-like protein n=1 Tax=Conidiobolus coronatus (strain ATCC 28846 / CBS 209.66 / NRRL 28638) TaxID=796925 RepID=A0A137NR56_CONC2|nr:acyl-CoA dehydrogenase NM domain-like protein [Conidiobolus coronatus NRRL 28638]|eukprot:KXN65249.1 acyl-CoA dehydrogenase NM domain-like protein [Conidiobolus coronatus NRRL 28638]
MVPYGDPTCCQEWHTPFYTKSHHDLRVAVRKFVDEVLVHHVANADKNIPVPNEVVRKAGELGFLAGSASPHIVKKYFKGKVGGVVDPQEFDKFHQTVIGDELARVASAGLLWGMTIGAKLTLCPIDALGSQEIKDKIIPDTVAGKKRGALVISEPYAGSDVASITTDAKLNAEGTHYIVNGTKKWITGGTVADYFLTAVRTGGPGQKGISVILIERGPGVKTRTLEAMGLHGSGTAFVTFEDVKVPVGNLIGEAGNGFKTIVMNFNPERMGMIIGGIRASRVLYEECFKYANKRRTFGKKLIEHAVIREKLAHMIRHVEACQHWADNVVYQTNLMDEKTGAIKIAGAISLLKIQVTQCFEFCAREACQIFGGNGYTKGGQGEKIERLYRDVKGFAIPGGSEEIMAELGVNMARRLAKINNAKL